MQIAYDDGRQLFCLFSYDASRPAVALYPRDDFDDEDDADGFDPAAADFESDDDVWLADEDEDPEDEWPDAWSPEDDRDD